MKRYIFLIATILLVVSCKQSRLAIDVREVDFINKSHVTLKGFEVDAQWPLGLLDITVSDSFLIVKTQGKGPRMHVYSDDYDYLGQYCFIGRAGNEFITEASMPAKQIFKTADGKTLIPLKDSGYGHKVMDLQQSLKSKITVITQQDDFTGERIFPISDGNVIHTLGVDFDYVFLDNDINHTFQMYNPVVEYGKVLIEPSCAVMYDTVCVKSIKLWDHFDKDDENYINGRLYKHPGRNLIIDPLTDMDYIIFFDLDNERNFAIHQSGSPSFDNKPEPEIVGEFKLPDGQIIYEYKHTPHFIGFACTDSFFMLLYFAGDYSTQVPDSDQAAPELLIFDWDGNFLKSAKMDVRITNIGYDERKQILYGVDYPNDRIICYDMSDFMSDM